MKECTAYLVSQEGRITETKGKLTKLGEKGRGESKQGQRMRQGERRGGASKNWLSHKCT